MKKYLLCVIVTILFVACDSTNDLGTPFTKGQEVTLTAVIGEQRPQLLPGKQRVSGKDSGTEINLKWDEGDQIKVIVGKESAIFTLTSGAGSSDGTFTGIMPADGNSFRVEYPIAEPDISTQTYIKDGFSNGLMKMVAENGTIDGGFILKAQYALLGLQLTGNQTLGKIILTNLSDEQAYTLNCENVTLKDDEATMFYIVVPVEGWENGMLVEVYDKDGVVILRKEKKGKIDFKTTEAMIMPTLEARGPGKRIGIFSVGEGKYVSFSQGNLQYIQSTKTWQFAENQQEYIGAANVNGGALADKIDLFGWSANNTTAPFGVSTSTNAADYAGDFVDWGVNTIQGDAPNTWRTLSTEEWIYLLQSRMNANQLWALGRVGNVNGLILLPDNWKAIEELHFLPNEIPLQNDNHYEDSSKNDHCLKNQYNLEDWRKMELQGAVFLPLAAYREGIKWYNQQSCSYNTSTPAGVTQCYFFRIYPYDVYPAHPYDRHRGRAVRLVHDTIL